VIKRVLNVSFDCDDVATVSRFWSSALDRPLDVQSEHFAAIGINDGERAEPAWFFIKVPEQKAAKNRNHLDLLIDGPADVDELVRLGAQVLGQHEVPGGSHTWTVMSDPEGNEFCVSTEVFTLG
jgi:glyoxalase superfamily protein